MVVAGLPPHFAAAVGQQHANHQLPLHLQQVGTADLCGLAEMGTSERSI